MFHATIRCGESTVHVIGDVTEYNLETLVDHARYGLAHGETVSMVVELDSGDHDAFVTKSQRWMRRLGRSGVNIDIAVASSQAASRPVFPSVRPLARRPHAVGH